ERPIVRVLEQGWHSGAALRRAEHSRLRESAGGAFPDHRERIVMECVQQRLDGAVDRGIRQTFGGPVTNVLVGIVNIREQYVGDAFGLDAAIADEGEIPHRIDTWSLFAVSGEWFEPIDGTRVLFDVPAGDVDLDACDTHGEIVRVDRRCEQLVQSAL